MTLLATATTVDAMLKHTVCCDLCPRTKDLPRLALPKSWSRDGIRHICPEHPRPPDTREIGAANDVVVQGILEQQPLATDRQIAAAAVAFGCPMSQQTAYRARVRLGVPSARVRRATP